MYCRIGCDSVLHFGTHSVAMVVIRLDHPQSLGLGRMVLIHSPWLRKEVSLILWKFPATFWIRISVSSYLVMQKQLLRTHGCELCWREQYLDICNAVGCWCLLDTFHSKWLNVLVPCYAFFPSLSPCLLYFHKVIWFLTHVYLVNSAVRANFEFIKKLGVEKWCFHDRDIAPEGSTLEVRSCLSYVFWLFLIVKINSVSCNDFLVDEEL